MSIKSSQVLVQEALKEIKTINVEEAYELTAKNQCNLIDIRDIRELEKEEGLKTRCIYPGEC